MKKFISLAAVLIMVAALFSGCGKQKKLLGAWEQRLDLSQWVQAILEEKQLGGDFSVSDFEVPARLEFFADGTFRLQLDQTQLSQQADTLITQLEDGLLSLLQAQLKEQQMDIPMEELLDASGLTNDALTQQLRQQFPKENLLEQLNNSTALSGHYKLKSDKLLLAKDKDSLDKDCYILCDLKGTSLTLQEAAGLEEFLKGNEIFKSLPLQFTKAAA